VGSAALAAAAVCWLLRAGTVPALPAAFATSRIYPCHPTATRHFLLPADHELEFHPDGTVFAAYNTRYPVPQLDGLPRIKPLAMPANGQPLADPVNMYYSYDIPGVAHMVYLSNYIPYDTWSTDSAQYKWLAADLAAVDRKVSR
jgi:hypothetical protein